MKANVSLFHAKFKLTGHDCNHIESTMKVRWYTPSMLSKHEERLAQEKL